MIKCSNITELFQYLNEIESYYRLGKENQASWQFNMASLAIEDFIAVNNIQPDEHLNNLFNVMLDAQKRRDNLFFADILAYELIPHLKKLAQQ